MPHGRGNQAAVPGTSAAGSWYPPAPTGYGFAAPTPPSNSREMRNRAEKQRRDRLNSYVNELANLVPFVAKSAKRMDKTSILRLAATYLRIYQTLVSGKAVSPMDLPRSVDQTLLEQVVCDQMSGFMLILTSNGKIVFVSQTVENLLGHLQTDLMGQSIFSVAHPDDQQQLRAYLRGDRDSDVTRDWRRHVTTRLKRAGPKNEAAVYEQVQMAGSRHRLARPAHHDAEGLEANNEVIVFLVKVARPEPIADQLLEASKDEYRTRHLIDGKIISCDQRISLVAGYLIEEVNGISAFFYMHRDDVRWVMIALRQMYDRGESTGSSCYRLKSRNGQFIYLRTQGFLEIDSQGTVESFVCINTLVDEQEGRRLINSMKTKFSALIAPATKRNGTQANMLIPSLSLDSEEGAQVTDLTEDPLKVQEAIAQLMSNLPSPGGSESRSTPSPHGASPSSGDHCSPQQSGPHEQRRLTSPPLQPSEGHHVQRGHTFGHHYPQMRLKTAKRCSTDECSDTKRIKVEPSSIVVQYRRSSPPSIVKVERDHPLFRQQDGRLLGHNC